ncbi:MAG: type II toxin-antitoxin system ParD family antitoxin [Blastocatellia bacterium]
MNVSLTPELEKLVNEKVKSGRYTSASEVVREGLRLIQEQDELRKIKLQMLRQEIAKGVEQLDRGEVIAGDQVFAELKKRNKALSSIASSKVELRRQGVARRKGY